MIDDVAMALFAVFALALMFAVNGCVHREVQRERIVKCQEATHEIAREESIP